MPTKRYYWLKLPEDFFRQKTIKKIRKIAGGDTYTIIYLEMLLIAIRNGGELYYEGVEDSFEKEIALEIDEEYEDVQVTVKALISMGLIVSGEKENDFVLPEAVRRTGSESAGAERIRRYRAKQAAAGEIDSSHPEKLLPGNNLVTERKRKSKRKEIDNKTLCAEASSAPEEKVFIQFPCNDGSMWNVTEKYVSELKQLYQAVDVEAQIREMRGWLDGNPRNRKTPGGVKRFITGWLAKEQDKAPRVMQPAPAQSRNRFNNFDQRSYDWDSLERGLIEADNKPTGT